MIMKHKLHQTAAITTLCLATLGGAYAASTAENDALAINNASIGLTQAISAAEQQVGGKASRAEYEREQGQWVFDVEVVKDSEVLDVQVDPISGKVLAAMNDPIDQGDVEDADGDGEVNDTDD
jgi:uncharacterized membrane protein YkoI